MFQINKTNFVMCSDTASSFFGDDWKTQIKNSVCSIFFDGHEVYASITNDGPFERLVLEAVHDDVNFEENYG